MVKRARRALSMPIADSMERGFINRNVARELKRRKEARAAARAAGRLVVGRDIPTPDEIRAILAEGPLAAFAAHRNIHRAAGVRIAWAALG